MLAKAQLIVQLMVNQSVLTCVCHTLCEAAVMHCTAL